MSSRSRPTPHSALRTPHLIYQSLYFSPFRALSFEVDLTSNTLTSSQLSESAGWYEERRFQSFSPVMGSIGRSRRYTLMIGLSSLISVACFERSLSPLPPLRFMPRGLTLTPETKVSS